MALSSTEPSLRVDEPLQNYQLDHTQQHHTESFTFDQANGAPHPGPVRAGRIDEGNLPHGQPELERQSQDVSPASSMGGSFTGGQEGREEGYSSRAQRKLDELRNLFKLPSDETALDDFRCAIKRRILHQGHLYVFERHVCFHSNVFGYVRSTVMPLKDVTAVKKQKSLGLPNSLEITCDGKSSFFTSFLSREDAYRLIIGAWQQTNPNAREYLDRQSAASRRGTAPGDLESTEQVTREPSETSDVSTHSREGRRYLMKTATGTHLHPVHKGETTHLSGYNTQHNLLPASEGDPRDPMQRTTMLTTPQGGMSAVHAAGLTPDEGGASNEGGGPPLSSGSDSEYGEDGDLDFAEDTPAPAIPNDWTKLVEGDLKCSSRSFYQRFLSDEVRFYPKWHEARGDTKVIMQKWGKHPHHGRVRDLQFVVKIKGYGMGPSQAVCHQVQRVRMYKGDHLVFETSQVMDDIPYGDRFKVEARWDIVNLSSDTCQVTTRVSVPWSKAPMGLIKRQVEKGVTESCKESHKDWMDKAETTLAEEPSSAASPRSTRPPSPQQSSKQLQARQGRGRRMGASEAGSASTGRKNTPSPFKSSASPEVSDAPRPGVRSGDGDRLQRRSMSRKASTRTPPAEATTLIFGYTQQQCLLTFLALMILLQLWSIIVLHSRGRGGAGARELGPRFDELLKAVQHSSGAGGTIQQLQAAVATLQSRVDSLTTDLAKLAFQCKSSK
ncbi:hypothetical protein WJX84_002729 [Apatococcus fuscideae]|uniref:VASt domain-containing protein n=1 Tax=Apatococcus fuscideae TaxID=2026836 RepID=A0AAW1T4D7_9CHLO